MLSNVYHTFGQIYRACVTLHNTFKTIFVEPKQEQYLLWNFEYDLNRRPCRRNGTTTYLQRVN